MTFFDHPRLGGLRNTALGAAIAAVGTFLSVGLAWWGLRNGFPAEDWHIDGQIVLLASVTILTGLGAAAGLASGRFRDAPVSWLVAVVAAVVAEEVSYAVDPSWPRGEQGFWGSVLYAAVFLVPFILGGHVLGVWGRIAFREIANPPAPQPKATPR